MRMNLIIYSTVLLIIGVVFPLPVSAEDKEVSVPAVSIAIVDVRLLLSESKAAQSIQKQIKKQRDAFVSDLADEEKDLRGEEKELIEKQSSLSPEDFAKKRKEFEEKLLETRRKAQTRKRDLEVAAAKATEKLRNEIADIVQDIADERGYNLVISAQDVLIGADSLNITDETMKALNKAVSSISLDVK